jgi:hypothetical protein
MSGDLGPPHWALGVGSRRARTYRSTVIGDEARVVSAFCAWLEREGWDVRREANSVDAERGDEHLYAEAKGRTAATGLDVDTVYGQLLRCMPDESNTARQGVVVPTAAVEAAMRVPTWVRQRLHIEVYEVADDGQIIRR